MYEVIDKISVNGTEIDLVDGPIGISLSGGTDSSLLLYLLMSKHRGQIHAFTMANDVKRRASSRYAQSVIERCMDLTDNRDVTHHVWYRQAYDVDDLHRTQKGYHLMGLFGLRYAAITADPPQEVTSLFESKSFESFERDPTVIRPLYYRYGMETHVPFTNIDKLKIAGIYHHLGLMDSLFPVTRSCESTEIAEGHCGRCWWCEERAWGFGRL
jgi:hypothetical protein